MEHVEIKYSIQNLHTLFYLAPFKVWVPSVKNAIQFDSKKTLEAFAYFNGIENYQVVSVGTAKEIPPKMLWCYFCRSEYAENKKCKCVKSVLFD